jgi:hypothetical protein
VSINSFENISPSFFTLAFELFQFHEHHHEHYKNQESPLIGMSEKPKLLPCGLHRLTKTGGLGLVVKSPETLISPLADRGGGRELKPLV